jgi:hypothetical protein
VTTWGIPPYTAAELASDPESVLDRTPEVVSQFQVNAKLELEGTVRLVDATLIVTGTEGADRIDVSRRGGFSEEFIVRRGRDEVGRYAADRVERIRIDGRGGDDRLQVALNVDVDAVLLGGEGDDRLLAGSGNDILLGGPGRDWLHGFFGRDILVGGGDRDWLYAGNEQDVLIGGSTDYDSDLAAWDAIWQRWSSPASSYEERVADLLNGNGIPPLHADTLGDDGVRDFVLGQSGRDLFFEGLNDWLIDNRRDERVARP